MGIQIKKVCFTNYRQYGTQDIVFEGNDNNNLSVFIAKNGTGKTTMLNAITWCLYEEEKFIGKNEALPLLNTAVLEEANEDIEYPVKVSVQIEDEDSYITFNRSLRFRVTTMSNGNKNAISEAGLFEVVRQKKKGVSNTEIINSPEAEMIVRQYFNPDIYDFYFFDGEQLKDFFDKTKSEVIKGSIFNISQVTLLENAIKHLGTISWETKRQIAKTNPNYEAILNEKADVDNKIDGFVKAIQGFQAENDELSKKRGELESLLRTVAPIKQLQDEREEKQQELDNIEEEEKELAEEKHSFLREYMIILSTYPSLVKTLGMINRKETSGELPPQIDRELVQKLIDHIDERCPVCDQEIGDSAREHLQRLLDDLSVSSATSNYLKEIKYPLEEFVEDAKEYKSKRTKLINKENAIASRREKCEKRLEEIGKSIGNYDIHVNSKVNIPETERNLQEINDKISANVQSIATNTAQLEIKRRDQEKLARDLEKEMKKANSIGLLIKEDSLIDSLLKCFHSILERITGDMRKEIEEITDAIFHHMIWKKNTFGDVTIDDSYQVKVFDKKNHVMTGSLSATEQMALAYAFTLAVHQASGKNCPLVIDSPLGRVSDENRANMAKSLYEVSKEKQIIMLFTPDEYSEEVKRQYDLITNPITVKLSEDESHIEEVF